MPPAALARVTPTVAPKVRRDVATFSGNSGPYDALWDTIEAKLRSTLNLARIATRDGPAATPMEEGLAALGQVES